MSSTTTTAPTDRPRFRSSTIGSIYSLTRALRESLRARKLRKQKRRNNDANNQQMRRRSKSVGAAYVDDEISEIGVSAVVASDIGPMANVTAKDILKHTAPLNRKQSKSADEVELEKIKKVIDDERNRNKLMVNSANSCKSRRRSKDDHDLPKIVSDNEPHSAALNTEQKGFRKRFGRLFGSLRSKSVQAHSHLQPETPSTSPSSDKDGPTTDSNIAEHDIVVN